MVTDLQPPYATLGKRNSLSCNARRSLDRRLRMTITLRDFGLRQNWFKRFRSSWMLWCAAGNSAYPSWAHEHLDMKATRPPKRRNTLNHPLQRLTSKNTRILCITLSRCPFGRAYCWNLRLIVLWHQLSVAVILLWSWKHPMTSDITSWQQACTIRYDFLDMLAAPCFCSNSYSVTKQGNYISRRPQINQKTICHPPLLVTLTGMLVWYPATPHWSPEKWISLK